MSASERCVSVVTCTFLGTPKITLAEDTPVVEGERLKLHCNVKGNPTPLVVWSIGELFH